MRARSARPAMRFGLAGWLALASAAAAAAPFQNGSFEAGGISPCNTFSIPAGSTLITGWTVSTGSIDWEGAPVPSCGWQASNGSNSLDLVGASGIGGISQTFDTVPGTTYQLTFDMAGNFGALPVIKPLAVTVNGVTTNFTFDTTGRSASNMGWTTRSITFTATSASSTITFVSDVSGLGGPGTAGAALDNVVVAPAGPAATPTAVPLGWAPWAAVALIMLFAAAGVVRRGNRHGR
jgi:choice-of-anchor C domain-containing protein